jgi:hypothetical protein
MSLFSSNRTNSEASVTAAEIDAYEAAQRAERDVAFGAGDEDIADRWMGQANHARQG